MRSSLASPTKSPDARLRSRRPSERAGADLRANRPILGPLTQLERTTGYVAEMVADMVVWEAETYFHEYLPDRYVGELARRAERLFETNESYRRRISGRQGHDHLRCFFRHWLAGALAKERPALFRRLPDGFKIGRPIQPDDKDNRSLQNRKKSENGTGEC